MIIKKCSNGLGAVGLKSSKNFQPFCSILNTVTPPKLVIEKKKATVNCAVIVKAQGSIPVKLLNKMKIKM